MKELIQYLIALLILLIIGPIALICAIIGRIPPNPLTKEEIPIPKWWQRVGIGAIGMLLWITIFWLLYLLLIRTHGLPSIIATVAPTATPSPTAPIFLTPAPTPTQQPTPTPTATPRSTPTPIATPTPPPPEVSPLEIIVDDLDSGFNKYGPEKYWHEADIGYNNHMFWTVTVDQVENWATWCTSLPVTGLYEVYVFIPRRNATTEMAEYVVQHRNGQTRVPPVNQRKLYDEWTKLGQFMFDEGVEYCVILTDKTNDVEKERIGFDAVKWVFVSEH